MLVTRTEAILVRGIAVVAGEQQQQQQQQGELVSAPAFRFGAVLSIRPGPSQHAPVRSDTSAPPHHQFRHHPYHPSGGFSPRSAEYFPTLPCLPCLALPCLCRLCHLDTVSFPYFSAQRRACRRPALLLWSFLALAAIEPCLVSPNSTRLALSRVSIRIQYPTLHQVIRSAQQPLHLGPALASSHTRSPTERDTRRTLRGPIPSPSPQPSLIDHITCRLCAAQPFDSSTPTATTTTARRKGAPRRDRRSHTDSGLDDREPWALPIGRRDASRRLVPQALSPVASGVYAAAL